MIQVSVIIPTYNRAVSLSRALASVLRQKGADLEVIVVDDGSTDETRSLIEGRGGETPPIQTQIKYLYQPNRGPAAARNLGILNSSLEFIAFLDSDDEWLPGKLEAQLRFFAENPDSLICQTEEVWIRNGRRVSPMKKHKKESGWIFERCLELCLISPSAVMVRRKFFDEVGLFDESFPACEDYELWLRASARFPIGLIEKPYVVKYGGHADQRSKEFPVMDRFRTRAIEKILASGILNPAQAEAARHESDRKSEIIKRGAEKRMRAVRSRDGSAPPPPPALALRARTGTPFASGSGGCKKPTASETPGKPGAAGSETSSFAAALLSQRIGAGASSAVMVQ